MPPILADDAALRDVELLHAASQCRAGGSRSGHPDDDGFAAWFEALRAGGGDIEMVDGDLLLGFPQASSVIAGSMLLTGTGLVCFSCRA